MEKVFLLQIAQTSRGDVEAYQDIRAKLDAVTGRINGAYATVDWSPIRYVNRSYGRDALAGLYRAAKVGLVTPLRDGMNLVGKEYVAAQNPDDPGVLVLSRFAGAALQMGEALIVNPYSREDVADAIARGLDMPRAERVRRWESPVPRRADPGRRLVARRLRGRPARPAANAGGCLSAPLWPERSGRRAVDARRRTARAPSPGESGGRVTAELGRPSATRRIYYLHAPLVGSLEGYDGHFKRAEALGFDTVLVSPIFQPGGDGDVFLTADHARTHPALGGGDAVEALSALSNRAGAYGLQLHMDLALHRLATTHILVQASPHAFTITAGAAADPRHPAALVDEARPRLDTPDGAELVLAFAEQALSQWAAAGLQGVRVLHPHAAPAEFWRRLIAKVREAGVGLSFMAETQAAPREAVLALAGCGFDALTSSLPWWDGRARWFVEEHEALRTVAPLIAEVETPFGPRLCASQRRRRRPGAGLWAKAEACGGDRRGASPADR